MTKRVDGARLLVAGDPMEPVDRYQRIGGDLVEWRLGYLPQAEVDRAYGDATLAMFPYKPGLDQSGTLLRALGAGVPAVAYDVGRAGRERAPLRGRPRRPGGRRRGDGGRRCASCWTIRRRWSMRARVRGVHARR